MKISFIRLDNEPALGTAFTELCSRNGITIEKVPTYMKEPNGKIERAGKEISTKARCIGIAANLPQDLWPETIVAAAYILNRTPLFRTGMTPFEALYGTKPRLNHLYVYGCRAYLKRNNIPKLLKLEPRAHIGYLVGYDSRNIYRIWIPSKGEVIRTRDVTFDENTFYSLDDVDGALVEQEELHHVVKILQDIPGNVLAHNQDLDELEIPATADRILDPSTTNKQSDDVTMDQHQHYPSPALTDAGNTQGTPPSLGTTGGTNGEHSGERIGESNGEKSWEYRPVGAPAPRSIEISADLDPNNALPTRTRNRRQAHAAILNKLDHLAGYHAAFATKLAPKSQIHRDQLPEEPKNWK